MGQPSIQESPQLSSMELLEAQFAAYSKLVARVTEQAQRQHVIQPL